MKEDIHVLRDTLDVPGTCTLYLLSGRCETYALQSTRSQLHPDNALFMFAEEFPAEQGRHPATAASVSARLYYWLGSPQSALSWAPSMTQKQYCGDRPGIPAERRVQVHVREGVNGASVSQLGTGKINIQGRIREMSPSSGSLPTVGVGSACSWGLGLCLLLATVSSNPVDWILALSFFRPHRLTTYSTYDNSLIDFNMNSSFSLVTLLALNPS